jgi:hypothetical protein
LDIGIAEKLYNKMPGPGLGEKRLAALRDILNEGGTNLHSKTKDGNKVTDRVPEIQFNKFLDGEMSEPELRDEWTRGHSAKLAQYRQQYMKQFHHQQLFHQHMGSVGDMGGMSSLGGTPDLSTRHTGPRAADGSLDMCFTANRGHDKCLD